MPHQPWPHQHHPETGRAAVRGVKSSSGHLGQEWWVGHVFQVLWKAFSICVILHNHFNNPMKYHYPQITVHLPKFTWIRNGSHFVLEINVLRFGGWRVVGNAEKWRLCAPRSVSVRLRESCQNTQPGILSSALQGSTRDLSLQKKPEKFTFRKQDLTEKPTWLEFHLHWSRAFSRWLGKF